nr:PREDICTED: CAP-Gly domain-containing linker protein 1-like [Bemisia tabaci]
MTAMDEKTLLATIQDFFPELRIMPQDLKNPNPEFVIKFYNRVLMEMEVDLTNLQAAQPNQMEKISNLEMYQDIIPSLNLSKGIQYIFSQIGLGRLKFGLSDLLAPTPKRNMMLMSNLMNFVLFCDTRAAEFDPKFKEYTSFKVKFQELVKQRDELKRKINQQATERVHRNQVKEELLAQKDALETALQEMTAEYEESKAHQKQIKMQLKTEEQGLEKATYQVKNLEQELVSLREQIVSSPEEFQDQYDKLREQRNEAKEKVDNLLCQIEPKKETYEKLSSQMESQEIRLAILNEIVSLNQTLQGLKSEIGILTKEKSSAEEGAESAHEKLKSYQERLDQKQENLAKLQAQWNQQRCILNVNHETLQKELEDVEEKFEKTAAEEKDLRQEINYAVDGIKELEIKFNDCVATQTLLRSLWKETQDNVIENYQCRHTDLEKLVRKLT